METPLPTASIAVVPDSRPLLHRRIAPTTVNGTAARVVELTRARRRVPPRRSAEHADNESPVEAMRVLRLFAPFRWRLLVVVLTIVATSIVGLAQPFLIRTVVDQALPHQDTALLVWSVTGMLVVAAITTVLGVAQTWLATSTGQRVMHSLRTDVFNHLQLQSLDFFRRTRAGDVQARLTGDIAGLQSVVTTSATAIASNLTTSLATGVAMVVLNWRLSLLSLAVLPPAIWLTRRVAVRRRMLTAARQRAMAALHHQVEESLSVSGVMLGKTLGLSQARRNDFAEASATLEELDLQSQLAGSWRMGTMQLMFAVIPALVYLAAGFPQTAGDITIGTLIAFTSLQVSIFRPILGLLNVSAKWVSSLALLSRIFGYLDLPITVPAPRHPIALSPADVTGHLRVEGVQFSYPDRAGVVLSRIDLDVPAGQSVTIVGETGSGKSTLAGLIVRLADPASGRVLIDGHDIKTIAPTTLTSIVGVVTQEAYLIHGSIRANLQLAQQDADEQEMWAALRVAQVDQLVAGLPEGLDTVVGSRGHAFSGGERQRLAIARTLLRDPRILILDEATSALDPETAAELQSALDALARGRTTITITHRTASIPNSERVVVLDQGRIVQQGTRAELQAVEGRFATLLGIS